MEDDFLDIILLRLKDKYRGTASKRDFLRDEKDLSENENDLIDALDFLKTEDMVYCDFSTKSGLEIVLSPKGRRKVTKGEVFSTEDEYGNRTLEYARKSKSYAFWALIISVIAVILAVTFFIIEQTKDR